MHPLSGHPNIGGSVAASGYAERLFYISAAVLPTMGMRSAFFTCQRQFYRQLVCGASFYIFLSGPRIVFFVKSIPNDMFYVTFCVLKQGQFVVGLCYSFSHHLLTSQLS